MSIPVSSSSPEMSESDRVRALVAQDIPQLTERYWQLHDAQAAANAAPVPSVSVALDATGASNKINHMGMRPMQERVWNHRGAQYLLIKSPPASGKSRALMFLALDKLANQGLKQAIIVVPERSIGGSFANEKLSAHGFFADWIVEGRNNLCDAPGDDDEKKVPSKVQALGRFLQSQDRTLVCTHATFRFAFEEFGAEAFDNRLVAVDEFHHASADHDRNRLGSCVAALIERDKAHIVAMTGSYFRGDAAAVLRPEDESRFETVTYTYYEQLNGYDYLKSLDIGYAFYVGRYLDALAGRLDPDLKTIVHIPSVNSRESTGDKLGELGWIQSFLGEWEGKDEATGFDLVRRKDGRVLRIADLVTDDDPVKRTKILNALRDPAHKFDRSHVDVIVALGMAKEGFDWVWCEHALTIGYRSSLTEVVQIIGRATRDAVGKTRARFTNLIAEPDAAEGAVVEAVNDTLKAIAASLLMEQVLTPRFEFTAKAGPVTGFDYGPLGYDESKNNVGVNHDTGKIHVEIKGLAQPKTPEGQRITREDINEIVAAFVQAKPMVEQGLFNHEEAIPEEITQLHAAKIIRERYPELPEDDREAVRQHAIAAFTMVQKAKEYAGLPDPGAPAPKDGEPKANVSFIEGVRRYAMDVKQLDIDLIDRVNPFDAAYAILARSMDARTLQQVQAAIAAKRVNIPPDEALALAQQAVRWKKLHDRVPNPNSTDAWEQRLALGGTAYLKYLAEGRYARS